METKTCPDCGRVLPVTEFGQNVSRGDGLAFYCKLCFRRRGRAGYEQRRLAEGHTLRRLVKLPPGMKRCSSCAEIKDLGEFHRASRGGGHHSQCKPCRSAHGREAHLRRSYGLNSITLQHLVDEQGGACAICRERPAQHVDHDHVTGRVRGVLCSTATAASASSETART